MHSNNSRKRQVSTCSSCYTRKQKCDRRYPCNHCTRRRRPEECVYNLLTAAQPACATAPVDADDHAEVSNTKQTPLQQSFGFFEDSNFNTLALLRTLGSIDGVNLSPADVAVPHVIETIQQDLFGRMPPRPILDFLVQYFVSELNWMKQLIHAPSFLSRYQQWWARQSLLAVADIEYAVLVLRICSYAAQFLPSPTCTIDEIAGLSLSDIRSRCSTLGDDLARTCASVDWKGSLIRVQHVMFRAIDYSCQGRTDKFWEGIGCASRAAQKAGIHRNVSLSNNGVDLMERELERRVFCSLYVLDSHMARQLDRVPFLPDNIVEGLLPQMHFTPDVGRTSGDNNAPELFTERLMQLDLNRFWRRFGMKRSSEYDPTQSEHGYERFCADYLLTLPPAFALEPDTRWDALLPKLAMQRQVLHICIFDSICQNFRPLLLASPNWLAALAPYKQVLLRSQKKKLAAAALRELEAISALHSMFNNAHTRFAIVIFNTFEAAVLLLCLCLESHADVFTDEVSPSTYTTALTGDLPSRDEMLSAAQKALDRLRMLADISDMAASGARTLEQLFAKLRRPPGLSSPHTLPSTPVLPLTGPFSSLCNDDWDIADRPQVDYSDSDPTSELLIAMEEQELYTNLGWPAQLSDYWSS